MALNSARIAWNKRVGSVFSPRPRIGGTKGSAWQTRPAEIEFAEYLVSDALHICLDGPSGMGKTSIAITCIERCNTPCLYAPITKHTTWKEFCKLIVPPLSMDLSTTGIKFSFGVKGLIPVGDVSFSYENKATDANGGISRAKISEDWSEHDVCSALIHQKLFLFIDDFENADDSLVLRVADLMKLLCSYGGSKIIVTGVGRIYSNIIAHNNALEHRIKEVSVPAFENNGCGWRVISDGLRILGISDPFQKYERSKKQIDRDLSIQCANEVHEATAGTPKCVNELGRVLANRGFGRNDITVADVKDSSREILASNLEHYRQHFSDINRIAIDHVEVRRLFRRFYDGGIGKIYSYQALVDGQFNGGNLDDVENAIRLLESKDILIRTGNNNDRLFISNPMLAHIYGAVVCNPDKNYLLPLTIGGHRTIPFQALPETPE